MARKRAITRKTRPDQQLLVADKADLLNRIGAAYEELRSFNATVDMVPAIGSADKGAITEYKDIRAYIVYRRPVDIRLIGLYPVVRSKAFDMVSDGRDFKVYLPGKNRFVMGRNDLAAKSKNRMENLRPQHFLDAVVIRPVHTEDGWTILGNITDEETAVYLLQVVTRGKRPEDLRLTRQLWFDRATLEPVRQILFDEAGNIATDVRYKEWRRFDDIRFPRLIELNRPQDEYGVVITVLKMDVNEPLDDAKFALDQPAGVTVQVLGESRDGNPAGGSGKP